MKAFLQQTAEYLSNKYQNNFDQIKLVFPNQRSIMYFNKYLSNYVKQAIWAPECITINRLFQDRSDLIIAEELLLIFTLWQSFTKVTKSNESFDTFFLWGKTLLSDFDDMDKYLINAQSLFGNIRDIKELDQQMGGFSEEDEVLINQFWQHIIQSRDSDEKRMFTQLWEKLFDVYSDFKAELKSKNWAYSGMMYRSVVEQEHLNFDDASYWFIGFNALNACEMHLLSKMHRFKKAGFLWDYHTYYINNTWNEAGLFMRENLVKLPPPDDFVPSSEMSDTVAPNITCVSAISGVSQTKYMSDILSKWKAEPDFDPEETAVVLADEALLIPVMHGVPDIIGPYNVSMGYPLKSSSSAALISNLMKLQLNARVINNNAHFYFKQVIYLLNHPLIKRWVDTDIQEFSEQIVQQNRVRISVSDFEKVGLNPLFYQANNSLNEFIEYLNTINSSLLKIEVSDDEGLAREHEFLYKLWRGMLRINDLVLEHQIQFTDIRTYSQLLEQIIRSTNIPFDGEPLEGMQVVGFLETRPIDFKRVIMLSLNEGVFPKKSIAPSFIPQNLRLGFGLPSQEYRDAIFAYYFYRLLQRSKEVYILYNTATNDIGGGEPSRFITQLKYEWPYKIQFKNMMRSAYLRPVQQLTVKKDKRIYNQLVEICSGNAARKLSATALNQYIKCPMMFYFSTVLEHRDAEEISEEIDQRLFGSIFHKAMQLIYNPDTNNSSLVSSGMIDAWLKEENHEHIRQVLGLAFNEVYFKNSENKSELYGKHRIDFEILIKLIIKILESDRNYAPFEVWHEKTEFFDLEVDNAVLQNVRIKAFIDRIDKKNDVYRVLDYKTGVQNNIFLDVEELFSNDRKLKSDAVFQILLYTIMYAENHNEAMHVIPGLIYLRDIYKSDDFMLKLKSKYGESFMSISPEIQESFIANLKNLIQEILNPDIPFVQTQNSDNCQYCNFRTMCVE